MKRLAEILKDGEDEIVNETIRLLRESPGSHYPYIDSMDLTPREEAFFNAFRDSILYDDFGILEKYLLQVIGERLDEGYDLTELQYAIDCLAGAVWEHVAEASEPQELEMNLRKVAWRLIKTKDVLARSCIEHAQRVQTELLSLNTKFEEYLARRKPQENEK